jgi:hypothetical protein
VQGLLQDLLAVSDEQQPRPCPHPGRWRVDGRAGPDRRAMRSRARTRPLPSRRRNWPGTCEAWRASPAPPGARSTPAHRAGQPQKYSRSRCRRCWIHCGDETARPWRGAGCGPFRRCPAPRRRARPGSRGHGCPTTIWLSAFQPD